MLQEYNPKNENIFIHVNGELLPRKEAKVSVFDSIVQNGDGVWEGLRVYPEGIVCYDKHLTRLQEGAHALGYEGVPTKKEIKKAIKETDGPERANIESLTRSLCSLRDVMFIGKIPDVETVLYKADLFLLTSEKESFGLSALEAMASSVPVISSNAGGLPELVEEGISGFTCDIGDVNSMSEKAIKVLDKKNLSGFKENALRIANNYDINIILPKYVQFYKKILNKG